MNDIVSTPEINRISKAALHKLLLFKKPNGEILVRTVTLVSSREYAKAHFYDLSDISFKELPKDFSGYQMVMKWDQSQVSTIKIDIGQHNHMALNYQGIIKQALLEAFPNLNTEYADALAWGGLDKTAAFNILSQEKKTEIKNENQYQRLAVHGTACN